MKKEKNLTPTQELKALKNQKRTLFGLEIGSVVAPFCILSIVDFNEFFVKTEAWRTSTTFVMLAISTFIGVLVVAKDKFKVNLLSAFITLAAIDGILWFMGDLITKLAYILLYVILGFLGALIMEIKRNKDTTRIAELEEGIKKAKVDIVADEYKKEQKIKVVIKEEEKEKAS